jgi:hypothetical protein
MKPTSFENMFNCEFKSLEYQEKMNKLGLINDDNKEFMNELFDEFYEIEQLMILYKTQKEHIEHMRNLMLKRDSE